MHGLLTFVLIPSTQGKPLPVKENVVSPESTQELETSLKEGADL